MEKSTRESTRNAKFNLSKATKLSCRQRSPTSLFLSFCSNVWLRIVVASSWLRIGGSTRGGYFSCPVKVWLRKRRFISVFYLDRTRESLIGYFSDNVVDRIIAAERYNLSARLSYKGTHLYSSMINANPKNYNVHLSS